MANYVYKSKASTWQSEVIKREDVKDAMTMLSKIDSDIVSLKSKINENKYGELRRFYYDSVNSSLQKRVEENANMITYSQNIHREVGNVEHAFYDGVNKVFEGLSIMDLKSYKVDNTLGITEMVYDHPTASMKEQTKRKISIEDILGESDVLGLKEQFEQYQEELNKLDPDTEWTYEMYISAVNTTNFNHERYCNDFIKGVSWVLDVIPVVGSIKSIAEGMIGTTMTGDRLTDSQRQLMIAMGTISLAFEVVTLGNIGIAAGNATKLATGSTKQAFKVGFQQAGKTWAINATISLGMSGSVTVLSDLGVHPALLFTFRIVGTAVANKYVSQANSKKTLDTLSKHTGLTESQIKDVTNYLGISADKLVKELVNGKTLESLLGVSEMNMAYLIKETGKNANEINKWLADNGKNIDNINGSNVNDIIKNIKGTNKLTSEQIREYLNRATRYSKSDTFILGSIGEYDTIGKTNRYTHFKMSDSQWDDLVVAANGDYYEIWKVNVSFIDEQVSCGKNILLSNDPNIGYYFPDGTPRFYQRELDYLKDLGYSFEEVGNGIWKAIKNK